MTFSDYRCDECGRDFVDANALLQHRKFKHREPFPKSRALIAEAMEAAIFDVFDMSAPGRTVDEIANESLEDWEKPYAY